jgi:hypothetical protein
MPSKPQARANTPYFSAFDREWEQVSHPSVEVRRVIEIEPESRPQRNRRRGDRIPTHLPVLIVTARRTAAVHCTGTDLSLSGAHLSIPPALLPGTEVVRVCLMLPNEMLRLWARPVRSTPHGRAVEFVSIDRKARSHLASFINARRPTAEKAN